jgi:hypothetical protein
MSERVTSAESRAGARSNQSGSASVAAAAPGLARLAATAWWNTAGWTVETSVRAGSRVFRATVLGDRPGRLLKDAGNEARKQARWLLRVLEVENGATSAATTEEPAGDHREPEGNSTNALRERGAELLRRSADVQFEESAHPAYARILEVMAPDEARILRLLAQQGPQPSVDVRRGIPIVASELVAPGLTMIGAEAGCRHLEDVHAYLNNLYRLGLIWFSREPVKDRLRYQVLEAQPEVAEALKEAGRTGRTVRRSIHLTPFGEDFCKVCLPLDTDEFEAVAGAESEPVESEPVASEPGPRVA